MSGTYFDFLTQRLLKGPIFKKVQEDSRRFTKVQQSSTMFKKAQEQKRRFENDQKFDKVMIVR